MRELVGVSKLNKGLGIYMLQPNDSDQLGHSTTSSQAPWPD